MLSVIHKYIIKEMLFYFFAIQVLVIFLVGVVDYLSNMDEFFAVRMSMARAVYYVMLKLPMMSIQLAPAAFLVAVITVFGIMNRHNEIIALKSGGISPGYMLAPLLGFSLFVAFLVFFISEVISPATTARANYIKTAEIRKTSAVNAGKKNIWIKGDRQIIHVNYFDPASKNIHGISLYRFDQDFRPSFRIDATSGEYRDGKWALRDIMSISMKNGQESVTVLSNDSLEMDLGFTPDDARAAAVKSEEMGIFELVRYIRKVEHEGYDATLYRVDLMSKLAFPFASFIMAIAGAGIASRRKMRERLSVSIGLGILVLFFYWTLNGFSVSLGYGGMLPSIIAAWSANLVSFSLSVYIFLSPEG